MAMSNLFTISVENLVIELSDALDNFEDSFENRGVDHDGRDYIGTLHCNLVTTAKRMNKLSDKLKRYLDATA
jgi:Mg2+ and Co2+ transporter CorA